MTYLQTLAVALLSVGLIGVAHAQAAGCNPAEGKAGCDRPASQPWPTPQGERTPRPAPPPVAPIAPAPTPPAASPAPLSGCGPGGCWNSGGARYEGGAGGAYLDRGGKLCQRNGNWMTCF